MARTKQVSEGPLAVLEDDRSTAFDVRDWPLDRLVPYARNPRKNDGAVGRMAASIREFGFKIPVLARSDGSVVDGHLRLKAAQKLKLAKVPVILCDEWSDAQVKAFRLMVNRSVSWAEWDDELLSLEMVELKGMDFDLSLTGFDEDESQSFLAMGESAQDTGGRSTDSLLSRLNITIADPKTEVAAGDVWMLGEHALLCESVIEGWPIWSTYLRDGALFCPFPGPFVLLSAKALQHPLVLVQPDPYIAGHIVDRYIDLHGDDAVTRRECAADGD